jgi:peptidoglycan/xylan/chitin deacetylase (PgdA/CDA1 family)
MVDTAGNTIDGTGTVLSSSYMSGTGFQSDGYGPISWDATRIQNQPPVASFTYSPEDPMMYEEITFDASASYDPGGQIVSYHWDFGDGNTAEGYVVTHAYVNASDYTASLTVTDNDGMINTTTQVVKVVAVAFMLTFDDGPVPGTVKVVDALKDFNVNGHPVRAGFFMVGDPDPEYYGTDIWLDKGSVTKYPEIVRYVQQNGHIVANHTQHHAYFPKWQDFGNVSMKAFVQDEILRCNTAIENAIGQTPPNIFRPPYVYDDQEVRDGAAELGFQVVMGTSVGDTWPILSESADFVKLKALWELTHWQENKPCVLFFHDIRPVTCDHIGEIVSDLQEVGFTLVDFDPGRISGENPSQSLMGLVTCPVDLIITDPDGLVLSKQENQIPGASYEEADIDGDGDLDDEFFIPEPKIGDYSIQVIQQLGALPEDTYSLEVGVGEQVIVLANNAPISEIPAGGYAIRSTEMYINAGPIAVAGSDQTVEATNTTGAEVMLNGSGSYDPDNGPQPLSYSWTWAGGSASGVNPTIVMPIGTTLVTLEVSDGELSGTDMVEITVQDTTPPSVSIASPVAGQIYLNTQGTIPVQYTVTDACDQTPNIALTLDGNAFTGDKISLCGMASGQHILIVSATDHSGNTGIASSTFTVVPKAMKSFVVKNLAIQWAPHTPKSQGSDQFAIIGRFQLPQGYTWASLQNQATVSITIAGKSGNDTVVLKAKLFGKPQSTLWSYMGNEQPPGYGMNINNMVIWWSPQGTNWNGWAGFYIGGVLQLPEPIGVNTVPPDVTITIEIPVTAAAGCGSLTGTQTVKCSVSKPANLWFYNAWPNLPSFPSEPTGRE